MDTVKRIFKHLWHLVLFTALLLICVDISVRLYTHGEVDVYRDTETGCQYVGMHRGMTPRLDPLGVHICKGGD